MVFLPLIFSVAFAPFVLGQSNSTGLQVEAIEAHFNNSGIVPSLLVQFQPTAVFSLSFQGVNGVVAPGQPLTQAQVSPTPNLTVTPANGTYSATDIFTLAMVDAGPVGTDESKGQTRHWLVNGVTLTGTAAPYTISAANGTAITEYAGPAPPTGSGAHRYVILLYTQPSDFQAPQGLDTANVGVSVFDFPGYVQDSHLGALVAGTYFTVEAGTASVSPSSTAPVVTSTLPLATATSSGGAPSTSPTSPTSGSSNPTQSGSATTSKMISFSVVIAAFAAVVVLN